MGLIDDIKERIRQYENTIADDRQRINEYNGKIQDIDRIYNEMKIEKDNLVTEKSHVRTLSNETYANWKGDLHSNEYEPLLVDDVLNGSLQTTIRAIDENLDALNDAKTRFENKINRTEGIIGTLQAGVNSLWNEVENLLN